MNDRYDIFYQETLLATIVPPRDMKCRYIFNVFGVLYLDVPNDELLIQCPIADVRVLKNGTDRTLTVVREIFPGMLPDHIRDAT